MAGIGFALRDLMRRDGLWALIESQLHGIVAVAGPWFFTILAMALPALLFDPQTAGAATSGFVTLLMYIFSITLTLTSPIAIGMTRHVSDCMYQQRNEEIAASFLGALVLGLLTLLPLGAIGMHFLDFPLHTKLLAILCSGMVTMNWIAAPMLSTIRQFRALTLAYAAGVLGFWLLLRGLVVPSLDDLLLGFTLGMGVTNAAICALVLHGFPGRSGPLTDVLRSMLRYWDLALGGLFYGAGIWADKWLMWSAPEHVAMPGGLFALPTYDTVVFIAYITTVPALSLFVIKAETSLHEACDGLYASIQQHASHARLRIAQDRVIATFHAAGRDVGLVQLCLTALVLLLPTLILDAVKVQHSGVFMFRFCTLGAAFQSGVLMLTIVLHYFDSRRTVLAINALFLAANLGFSWLSLHLGLRWYGFGYFLAALTTFAVAYLLVNAALRDMLYLAFVRQNAAVTDAKVLAPPATVLFEATTEPGPLAPPHMARDAAMRDISKSQSFY